MHCQVLQSALHYLAQKENTALDLYGLSQGGGSQVNGCSKACRILVPQPGNQTHVSCNSGQILNQWTTRKFPQTLFWTVFNHTGVLRAHSRTVHCICYYKRSSWDNPNNNSYMLSIMGSRFSSSCTLYANSGNPPPVLWVYYYDPPFTGELTKAQTV